MCLCFECAGRRWPQSERPLYSHGGMRTLPGFHRQRFKPCCEQPKRRFLLFSDLTWRSTRPVSMRLWRVRCPRMPAELSPGRLEIWLGIWLRFLWIELSHSFTAVLELRQIASRIGPGSAQPRKRVVLLLRIYLLTAFWISRAPSWKPLGFRHNYKLLEVECWHGLGQGSCIRWFEEEEV